MSQIELILSRHGETEENKLHIMQGQLPGHLSELGKQQAKALAETLDKEELDVIVCSDLARSYDTAMAVARQKGLQPVATPLLREMDWGIYTGKVADEMDFTTLPESVETIEALYKRAGDFVDFLKKEFPGKRILAIGHGGFNRAIIVQLEKLPPEKILSLPIMKNTACMHAFHAAVISQRLKSLADGDRAVFQAVDNGKAFYTHVRFVQHIASLLESFFDDKAHSFQLGARLFHQVEHAHCGIAIRQKVVNKEDTVIGSQKVVTDTHRVIAVFRKRMDNGRQHILHCLRLFFLDKNDRQMHDVPHHNRRSDTTCFYRHDLIDIRIPETVNKFFCHLIKQHGIHLMVNKAVNL